MIAPTPLDALLDLPAADSAHVRALLADYAGLLSEHDRVALRVAARGHADQRYLDALLAARRQAERAAIRHVRAVMAKATTGAERLAAGASNG